MRRVVGLCLELDLSEAVCPSRSQEVLRPDPVTNTNWLQLIQRGQLLSKLCKLCDCHILANLSEAELITCATVLLAARNVAKRRP